MANEIAFYVGDRVTIDVISRPQIGLNFVIDELSCGCSLTLGGIALTMDAQCILALACTTARTLGETGSLSLGEIDPYTLGEICTT